MDHMILGVIATASMVVALFFIRFWRSTRDRFFLFFAMSFGIEGLNRIISGLTYELNNEDSPVYYLIRLVSYSLIVIAILEKNRPRGKR